MIHYGLLILSLFQFCLTEPPQNNITETKQSAIINLDHIQGRTSRRNRAPQIFWKFQSIEVYGLSTVSTTFSKVPGLALVFHHSQPRLYTIRLQGQLYTNPLTSTWVRVLFDDQLPHANRLLPNNHHRTHIAASLGTDLLRLDARGGIHVFASHPGHTYSCAKTDILYVPAGVHSVEVGVRTDVYAQVEGFQLLVELLEIDEHSSTNLPLLTI